MKNEDKVYNELVNDVLRSLRLDVDTWDDESWNGDNFVKTTRVKLRLLADIDESEVIISEVEFTS